MAQLPTVEEEVFFVRALIPNVDEETTQPNTNTFGINDISKAKQIQAPGLSLHVGDTLQIIEVSPDKRWCKAIITTRFATSTERRITYGLSGSNAITIKEKHTTVRKKKESPPSSPPTSQVTKRLSNFFTGKEKTQNNELKNIEPQRKPPNSSRWLSVAPNNEAKTRSLAPQEDTLTSNVGLQTNKIDKTLLRTNTTPDMKRMKAELSIAPKPGESKGLRPVNSTEQKEILKIHFKDGSFRTISISQLQCASQVCDIIGSKLKHSSQIASEFCLWEVSPNGTERLLSKDERPAEVVKSWKTKDEKKLVFTITQKSAEKLGQSRRITGPRKDEEDDGLEVLLDSLAKLATKRDVETMAKANGNLSSNELEGLLAELVSTASEWNEQKEEDHSDS